VKGAQAIVLGAALALAPLEPGWAAEAPAPKTAPAPPLPPNKSAPAPTAPPAAPAPPPPYEPQLLRLAEMMGALAYLRDLCGQGDGAEFRAKLAALIDAEGVDERRRDLLAGAYNKGFLDYATSFRTCGPAAKAVMERYLSETARRAADVAGRYGG
jgi:uncharacterized protein (TIGR02301 family)